MEPPLRRREHENAARDARSPFGHSNRWPGLERHFTDEAVDLARSRDGLAFRKALSVEMDGLRARERSWPMGPPALIRRDFAAEIAAFAHAYHAMIERIIERYPEDERLRAVLAVPSTLRLDVDADALPVNRHVHLCRLDLMLDSAGGFRVLETNANCPGALFSSGTAARLWRRELLQGMLHGAPPLAHEHPAWTCEWFSSVARRETGEDVEFVALLREDGGNRGELPGLQAQFHLGDIECFEADPREITIGPDGYPYLRGRRLRHAYLKLGIAAMARLRPELDAFVDSVQRGYLFVQNGIRGRLIGDNKLALAVLSDPSFDYLFEDRHRRIVQPRIPWSRNAATCTRRERERIRRHPEEYVLKRPLDTRGQGVVVGRAVNDLSAWDRALELAVRESWLVQEHCGSTRIRAGFERPEEDPHDLCVGVVDGEFAGALLRSSPGARMNIAGIGRLHQTFVEQ